MIQVERYDELFSNGKISITQYAEWLIREGKLPENSDYSSKEVLNAAKDYFEKNRVKLSAQSYDVYGIPLNKPDIESEAFFNKIKPLIIGKPVNRILSKFFSSEKENYKKQFTVYIDELNNLKKYGSLKKQNTIITAMYFGSPIILEIVGHLLEFKLWAPWRFEIKLNSFLLKESFDVKGKTVREVAEASGYKDISCLYGNALIGQKITNITFVKDEADIVEFVFELSNGNELHLYEDLDEPIAELYIMD